MIGFFHEYEDYGCFSNWYPAEFDYAGMHYVNSEQYMMYQKVMMFGRKDLAKQIMSTPDPARAKKIAGQHFPEFDSGIWEKTCYTIVKRGVRAKFGQNPYILEILLGTGNELLAECSPYDKKWGIGIDIGDPARLACSRWKGKNLLGRALMEVREDLRYKKRQRAGGALLYTDAEELDIFPEWLMTAGTLRNIPQFYDSIHAYVDTLQGYNARQSFYFDRSLREWEDQVRRNTIDAPPAAGFFELKQDIFDIADRLRY